MRMIGGIVAMQMTRTLLAVHAVIMHVTMIGQLNGKFGMARGLAGGKRGWVVGDRSPHGGQQHAKRHHRGDGDPKGSAMSPTRHT